MSSDPDYLQRALNAEQIASVIAHRRGHSFAKHKEEFGGDINVYRQAIVETLTDPKTYVVKCDAKDYRFYNKERGILVLIDPESPDWGTAFRPNGNRGMMYMRERGLPLHENGNVKYLNKLNMGFFQRHERLNQYPAPIQLNTLTPQQSAEVLLSIFDRIESMQPRSSRLNNAFNAASLNVMPEMIAKIHKLPQAQKDALRACAETYKDSSSECAKILQESGLGALRYQDGRAMDVAGILRDPETNKAFIDDLEEKFAASEDAEEIDRLGMMLEGYESFTVPNALRQGALEETCRIMDEMKLRPAVPSLQTTAKTVEIAASTTRYN